jgi:hypothetical protein
MQELRSLREELAGPPARAIPSGPASPSVEGIDAMQGAPAAAAAGGIDASDQGNPREHFQELVKEFAEFVEEAGMGEFPLPGAGVMGALVMGILIGRVMGRT